MKKCTSLIMVTKPAYKEILKIMQKKMQLSKTMGQGFASISMRNTRCFFMSV